MSENGQIDGLRIQLAIASWIHSSFDNVMMNHDQ